MNIKLVFLINFLTGCIAYTPGLIKAPLYRYWNCIGFKNCIPENKPYQFNVGEIYLLNTWVILLFLNKIGCAANYDVTLVE